MFANHVLLGGPVGAASGLRYAVKAHGSELEYSMRGRPELDGLGKGVARPRGARCTSARRTSGGCSRRSSGTSTACTRSRPASTSTSSGRSRARRRSRRCSRRRAATRRTRATARSGCPTRATPSGWREFFARDEPTVVYFGKLLRNKGVHLLFEALREVDARALVIGFGDYREELERQAPPGTLFTGPLEHRHLRHALPLCDVAVVPSIFPEAFGMVAAEAAAAGCPPLVARHSGLAEVAAGLEQAYPPEARELAAFESGNAADLAAKLRALLALPPDERAALGAAARQATVERWSWASVADRLLQAVK